jgi:hypothetical protein
LSLELERPFGPIPSPSLSPVGSSLLGREPAAESIARLGCRVFRIPIAAEPRDLNSQLSYLNSVFKNPVIVIYEGDLSTHRSCSLEIDLRVE